MYKHFLIPTAEKQHIYKYAKYLPAAISKSSSKLGPLNNSLLYTNCYAPFSVSKLFKYIYLNMHCSVAFTDFTTFRIKEFLEQRICCVQNRPQLWPHLSLGGIFFHNRNSGEVWRYSTTAQIWPELAFLSFHKERWQQKVQVWQVTIIFKGVIFKIMLMKVYLLEKKKKSPNKQNINSCVNLPSSCTVSTMFILWSLMFFQCHSTLSQALWHWWSFRTANLILL